ncbi:kinase-like protein [Aureobasidium pullulans]|uniref:Kinase-like protein n=1 Tax=Aureobasidium pullulans TaxID=5580 RepID=A0AB74K6N0_AURPU|nr:kinase-like protein [Aureobasidium pullulans]THX65635.1 kinase-like protein [Aureobasidium pullulans]
MSTPQTATATLAPNHYQPHQYLPAMTEYPYPPQAYANGYPPPSRTATTTATAPAPYPAPPSTAASSNGTAAKRQRNQPVDWNEYFGGKPPKEIIVIDDDDEDEAPATNQTNQTYHNPPVASASTSQQHMDKRRKTTNYDAAYHHAEYSNTHTPYYDAASTDQNPTSYKTSAATSLASQPSASAYAEDAATGQKRKRTTRQGAADQKKREVNARPDPFAEYVPPPKPPLKAKDVFVPLVPDRTAKCDQKVDDDDGHYIVHDHADLTERYSIVKLLGQGTFGKVVQAYDRRRNADVAIKIIRSVQKYRDASRIELRVLSTLACNDKHNRNKCIHLRDTFDFRNHICIVTDLLGQSVFDFLKSNSFVPFPSTHIQQFARQLFTSVAFLHDLNLIHTDLKPENILLVQNHYQTFTYNRNIPSSSNTNPRSAKFRRVLLDPEIRLIDFGSATFDDEYHSSVVSTRHYRAPEIILNLGWSFPCDIWSIGCILVEFFTGDALFQTHDNLEHLAMMEAVCNTPIDKALVRLVTAGRGSNKNSAAAYFRRQILDYPQSDTPRSSRKFVKAMKPLHVRPPPISRLADFPCPPLLEPGPTAPRAARPASLKKNQYAPYLYTLQEIIPAHNEFNRQFLDLLKKIFVYDPKKRITAHQALQHEWFKEHYEDDGTEAEKIKIERQRAARLDAQQRSQQPEPQVGQVNR